MNQMEACFGTAGAAFLHWVAPVLASFFPWPILVLIVLFFSPVRSALGSFATSFAELPRAVTAINVAGLKINLDPSKAKELLTISSEVVFANFERVIDREVERLKIWEKFEAVIDKALRPLIDQSRLSTTDPFSYRVTLHMPDTLQPESLYQLIEYFPLGPFPKSRGRRLSIRFGAIGKAWRLQRSEYSPTVSTEREKLIEDWGMTGDEADKAGRGRQTFLAVIIVDNSRVPLGIFYVDATPAKLLGDRKSTEIADVIMKECMSARLTEALVKIRTAMQDQAATPKLN
jgi:hypothetical protein